MIRRPSGNRFLLLLLVVMLLPACAAPLKTSGNHTLTQPPQHSLKTDSGHLNNASLDSAREDDSLSASTDALGMDTEPFASLNEPNAATDDGLQEDASADASNEMDNVSPDEVVSEMEEEATYDVPIVRNESVEDYVEYFQTEIKDKFTLWLERSGRYIPLMREIFKQHGLPEDLVFVALIESGFNPYAYSRARAVGAWQFIKGTALLYGLRVNDWVDERRDPIKSTDAAARYLKDLYGRFGSWPLAMAGYNAGEGKIGRALIKAKTDDFWDLRSTRHIRLETKGYVPKFMAATIIAKNPERYGFTLDYHDPLRYDTVMMAASTDLRVVAEAAGVTYEELKALNPELRTELTPPYAAQYPLRLPAGTQTAFTEAYSRIPEGKKTIGTRYTIRKNDSLASIAKRHRTTVSLLRDINHLSKEQMLIEGETLFIPKIKAIPPETKARVASVRRPALKAASAAKKPPVRMSASNQQSDADEDGKKILYRVKDGDTLWDISKSFNVSIQNLKRYNGMGKRSLIRPGDQLVLGFESKDL